MPGIRISVDITGYVEEVDQARNRDIPFVTAKALTRTAQDAQAEVRRQEQRVFTLRNSWTQQNTKITPAEKLSWPISAEVFTDTGNESAPDYLGKQEIGGEKQHYSGTHFAIPTKYLRALAPTSIPRVLKARNLLPAEASLGQAVRGQFQRPATGRDAQFSSRLGARKLKKAGSIQYVAFKQYDRRGTLCIFVRIGVKRDAEPWYVLVARAGVRPVLEMEPTVTKTVEQRFEDHWDDAWADLG